jgi:hypothetical protein
MLQRPVQRQLAGAAVFSLNKRGNLQKIRPTWDSCARFARRRGLPVSAQKQDGGSVKVAKRESKVCFKGLVPW